jgi:ribosome-binding protein aMBF1 (putative translation factor)
MKNEEIDSCEMCNAPADYTLTQIDLRVGSMLVCIPCSQLLKELKNYG